MIKIHVPKNMETLTSFNKLVFSSKKDRNRSSEKIKCDKINSVVVLYTSDVIEIFCLKLCVNMKKY